MSTQEAPVKKKSREVDWPIIGWTFFISLGYAVVRYHLLGDVPWKDLPVFILNKTFAMSALILLAINFALGPLKNLGIGIPNNWMRARRYLGIMGFMQAFVHLLLSLILLNPGSYGKFYAADGMFTFNAGMALLGGVLGFLVLWVYNISFNAAFRKDKDLLDFITSRPVLLIGMFFVGLHLFFFGYEGWLNPAGWHGGLPPISLVTFSVFAVGFTINLFGRE